jgi:hypothetical protein
VTKLADLQRNFISDCLSGKLNINNTLLSNEIDTRFISAQGLMGIYQNSAIGNIINALAITYPVIQKLVGEEFFRAMCRRFITKNWPKTANLDDYGADYPLFLLEFEHVKHLAYLSDVGYLEWLFQRSSLADDSEAPDWSVLTNVEANETLKLKFKLSPWVRLIKSVYPIDKIWTMNQENTVQESTLDCNEQNDTCLVLFRKELKTDILLISAGEFAMLSSFYQGLSFDKAIENSTREHQEIAVDETIKKFIGLNIINSVIKG